MALIHSRGQQLFRTMSHGYDVVDSTYDAASALDRRLSIATVDTLPTHLLPDAMANLPQCCPGELGAR
jgi:hypothetical protein